MADFTDRVKIFIKSGKGGDGHISFHREKFVTNGGPDGGDGGKGGDVVFVVDEGASTLGAFRYNGRYHAENGENGGKRRCTGKQGADLVLKVPEGTVVREFESGRVIADMSGEQRRAVILRGGRGGTGNMHYATSTMQIPRYAKPGGAARELTLLLELKLIADVGLVGLPNVGKSTFLSKVSAARPKVANYHFTTLHPSLGVVDSGDGGGFVMADIPGLIEGAANGAGLGHDFLRHIDRTRLLVHVVDAAGTEGRDPVADYALINAELAGYSEEVQKKPQIVAANKIDMLPGGAEDEAVARIRKHCEAAGVAVFPVSTLTGEGLQQLLYQIRRTLDDMPEERIVYAQEYFPEEENTVPEEPFTVTYDAKHAAYVVEGPRIEKMLGYTNLESEKGFAFFQRFLEENGILAQLQALGIQDGDTVRMYGNAFDYYAHTAEEPPQEEESI